MAILVPPIRREGQMAAYEQEVNDLSDFIKNEPDKYDGGMFFSALALVLRETAKYNFCDFAEIRYPGRIDEAIDEQKKSGNDVLICTPAPFNKENDFADFKTIISSLETIKKHNEKTHQYKKILFPVGIMGYGGKNHATALAIEGNQAYLFEQFGGNAYEKFKNDFTDALTNAGYKVHINRKPLTDGNRGDCATVSSAIISQAIKAKSIKELFDAVESKPTPFFTHEQIDAHHKKDQTFASLAQQDILHNHRDDRNNSADVILFQKLLSKPVMQSPSPEMVESFWNAKDKNDFVNNCEHIYQHIKKQNQRLNEILNTEQIPEKIRKTLIGSLYDTATKEAFLTEYEAYKKHHVDDVFVGYSDLHDSIAAYYNLDKKEYGDGTKTAVSSLIAYQTAQKHNVCFVDTPFVRYTKGDKATELKNRIDASKKTSKDPSTIVLGPVETSREEDGKNVFDPQTLSTILSSEEIKDFKTAIMPVSLTNYETGTRHMVSLVLYKDGKDHKAMLIDQCGKDAYIDSKDKIKNLLATNGYDLAYEPEKEIMDNRNDCAIFAAMINDAAVTKSAADLEKHITDLAYKSPDDKVASVDNYNQECKKMALDAYWDIFKANPLFKQYIKATGFDISTLDEAQKMRYLKEFNNGGVISVGDELTNDDRVSDPAWKEEVRKAVAETNRALSQDFKEYTDAEHPDHLFFRDQNNASNIIAFASKEQAYVEGEQAAFDQLVVTAKNLGKDTIAFGTFEKHPEYRAKLYLACLKHGLKMKNAPELESLKEYPEYTAIQDIISGEEKKKSEAEKAEKIKALREEFRAVDKELSATKLNFMNDGECQKLLKEYKKIKTDSTIAKDKKDSQLTDIKNKIKETEPGKKLSELVDKKAQLFQKGFAEGILDEKRANDFANRHRSPIELKQKEGETDKDFADRKEKLDKAQAKPKSAEERLAKGIQREILHQFLESRKAH